MITASDNIAPGAPGIEPRWTSSAKSGVGTALSQRSRVWFTLSHGIFNEIYFAQIDNACVRDMGLIVTDGTGYFSEEKRDAESSLRWMSDGVPGFLLTNISRDKRYRIDKEIITDPRRDTVLQRVQFTPLKGTISSYRLYLLLAPHLGRIGSDNTAWVEEVDGKGLLLARRNQNALALACSSPWLKQSVGYVGFSDGWQDLKAHKQLTWEYTRAENGNVALCAEIDLSSTGGKLVVSLGFGNDTEEAARNAAASIRDGFDSAKREYIAGWQEWMRTNGSRERSASGTGDLSRTSLAVLRTHESKTTPGGFIASLSIPWGFSKGDNDVGGYHLVWSRDMAETAGGLLAAGAHEDVRRALWYLQNTQLPDGHWAQNMWLDGSPYWNGIQMDETALPILLVDLAYREKAITEADAVKFWPMVRRAATYLARNGPVSQEDRWEEDPGYSPFTLGAEIAGLLAAADLAHLNREASIATHLREIADVWFMSIDRWIYVSGTDWCTQYEVNGYYVRIASRSENTVRIKNVSPADDTILAYHLVSPDALALVRFGLRDAGDPRIRDTVKIIDALLKVETPSGNTWHRYNDDGYGEHRDGTPFDGTGIGRGWPLLTGERAHYEVAAGRTDAANKLLTTLELFANDGGLISEQVWDAPDIPERELFFGRPSGSAMPLVWAHAEYLKLKRSLRDGRIFDLPPQTVRRYLKEKTESPLIVWRFNHKIRSMPAGKILRIETMAPAVIHWSFDGWSSAEDVRARDAGLGIYFADLSTQSLPSKEPIVFTFYWPEAERWEGANFSISIRSPEGNTSVADGETDEE